MKNKAELVEKKDSVPCTACNYYSLPMDSEPCKDCDPFVDESSHWMAAKKGKKKMEPYSDAWERIANSLARSFAPDIHPCKHCGYPVIHGYCCTSCKSATP